MAADIRDDEGMLMDIDRFPFMFARSNCQSQEYTDFFEEHLQGGDRPSTDNTPTSSRAAIARSRCITKDAQENQKYRNTSAMVEKTR